MHYANQTLQWRHEEANQNVSREPAKMNNIADARVDEAHNSANNRHLPTTNVATNEVKGPPIRPVPTGVPPFNGGAHSE
jgi:hypothetical protein